MNGLGKMARTLVALASLTWAGAAVAQTVEVAPGVQVTKKTYQAPINEQPFFGFAEKTAEQRELDDKFVSEVVQATGSREKGFDAAMQRGWTLVGKGNFVDAAKRFNQAYLLSPEPSAIYHGFAVIAQARFNDADYADELFKIARTRPRPLKALNADYGRALLIAKRPKEAQGILEQATVDAPDFADAWSNLAFARFQNGDRRAACAAVAEAAKLKPSANVAKDMNILSRQAQCE
jgi:predicted Zn-dependent protease